MLTSTGKATGRDQGCMHTYLVDQVTLAFLALLRYTDQKYTVPIVSVYYYTVRGIATVLLHYAILYKNGMNTVT